MAQLVFRRKYFSCFTKFIDNRKELINNATYKASI